MRAGVRRAGVQPRRVAVDPQDATPAGLHRIMRQHGGSQGLYNTVTTETTVPNKSGVWRGRCCCCKVEVVLSRDGGGDDDEDAITHTNSRALHTHTHAPKHTCTQAGTHTHNHARLF